MHYNACMTQSEIVSHEIFVSSMIRPTNPTAFATVKVDVVRNVRDHIGPLSSEFVVRNRRVAFDKLEATLVKLEAKYPGCSHRSHSHAAALVAIQTEVRG